MSKRFGRTRMILGALVLLGMLFGTAAVTGAQDQNPAGRLPEGVYLKLTRDFYETLKNETGNETRVYSNDPSREYLRQIAVSSRFAVETNLEMIKQQDRIIQLLDLLLNSSKK